MDIGLHDKSMVPSGLRQYDLYNNRLEDRIMECLRIYEAFPMNGEVKQIIMDSAVEDYVVFLSLYLSRLFNRAEIIDTLTNIRRVYNIVVHIELSADEGIIGDLIVKQASNRA